MDSSTLCKDVKQEHQRCSNPSHSNYTEVTSAREELERNNSGGGQPMTPRSISKGFPSRRGGIDLVELYIYISFSNPLRKMQESYVGWQGSSFEEYQWTCIFVLKNTRTLGKKTPFISPQEKLPLALSISLGTRPETFSGLGTGLPEELLGNLL